MRKRTALTGMSMAAALAMALPPVAGGQTSPPQTEFTLKATVTPNKAGSKRRPQGVKLNVKAHWRTPTGFEKPVITSAVALFARGSKYSGGRYPRCSKRTLDSRTGIRGCPRRSIMGRGGAVAYADNVITRPRIVVVNGGPKRVYLYTTLFNPAFVQAPVPGFISRRSGRWAYRLRLVVPRVLQVVAGVPIALRDFHVTAGRGRWIATTSCPRSRRWPFQVTTFFNTGGSDTHRSSIRCRR